MACRGQAEVSHRWFSGPVDVRRFIGRVALSIGGCPFPRVSRPKIRARCVGDGPPRKGSRASTCCRFPYELWRLPRAGLLQEALPFCAFQRELNICWHLFAALWLLEPCFLVGHWSFHSLWGSLPLFPAGGSAVAAPTGTDSSFFRLELGSCLAQSNHLTDPMNSSRRSCGCFMSSLPPVMDSWPLGYRRAVLHQAAGGAPVITNASMLFAISTPQVSRKVATVMIMMPLSKMGCFGGLVEPFAPGA